MIVNISSDAGADIAEGFWFYEEQREASATTSAIASSRILILSPSSVEFTRFPTATIASWQVDFRL